MPSTVLIITNDHDEHADAVIEELHRRDVPVFRFHPEDFPDAYSISIETQDGQIDGEIRSEHHRVAFRDICAAWWRRSRRLFGPPPTLNQMYGDVDNFVKMQSSATVTALYGSLQTLWVGQPFMLRRAEIKALQLVEASKAGLTTPPTLFSNDKTRVAAFVDALGETECAIKPLIAVRADDAEGARLPLTTTLPRGYALDSVVQAPTTFQPYIDKAYELRCVVMGEKVFAAKLDSQASEITQKDWRAGVPGNAEAPHAVYDLPEHIEVALRRLVRSFDINFASIDIIVTPDGDFVFLDLNPNGQWLWLEIELGLPLVSSMADLLTTNYTPAVAAAPAATSSPREAAHEA